MFRIDPNYNIYLSRGDDVQFKFKTFINNTTTRYIFVPPTATITSSNAQLTPTINVYSFQNEVTTSGTYSFVYTEDVETGVTSWSLSGAVVELDDYGITFTGSPVTGDTLTVVYAVSDGCELYFYVFTPAAQGYDFLLKKTFKTNGDIITELNPKRRIAPVTISGTPNVDSLGNALITLKSSDTMNVPVGSFKYQVRAQVLSPSVPVTYITRTISNRYGFNVIEDDFSERVW